MRKKLGLSGKLMLMILFSALASAMLLVGMQVVLNKALWLYFDQPETQQKAVEKQVQELQSYIDRRGLSSRDIDKLDDWSVRNGSTMFIIYDRSRMLYSSYPLVAPVYEGRENVTEAVPAERWLPMYSLTFSDKETTAMFYYNGVDAYYGKGCEILLLVSFALFPLFFFLSSRKIIRYILLLSGEIQAMEGGDLDHPITIQGDDELALLATSLDGLRLTLRQQPGGSYRISVRTAKGVDACAIARRLGGGGHTRAAGCELLGNLDNAKSAILSEVEAVLDAPQEEA